MREPASQVLGKARTVVGPGVVGGRTVVGQDDEDGLGRRAEPALPCLARAVLPVPQRERGGGEEQRAEQGHPPRRPGLARFRLGAGCLAVNGGLGLAEVGGHQRGGLVTVTRLLGQGPGGDPVDGPGNAGFQVARRGCARLQHVHADLQRRAAREGVLARHHLVKERAEGEHVGPMVRCVPEQLFGRGIGDPRTPERLDARGLPVGRVEFLDAPAVAFGKAGEQAEVQDLRMSLWRDDDARGGEGAVHESQGVGVCQRVGQMGRQIERPAEVHRLPRQRGIEPLARHEFVHQVDRTLLLARLEQRGHVLMGERRVGLHEVERPRALGRVGHSLRQHADRHGPAEDRVAGAVDGSQRAAADGAQDVVVSDPVTHGTPTTILEPGRRGFRRKDRRGRAPHCALFVRIGACRPGRQS